MYFKRLEIFGFKSFAEKTTLNFEEGITAVVGPNGCGKSNIFDSIRWVLGEQSAKELRGGAMEDVIFNGTQNKPALNVAEVHLTFSNKNRALPIEYDEVTITRRLFRSGESEYLLNKTKVRLKDIHEMLYGTGIGKSAYSMIQQGKVEQIVSAKPEERRMIFDEASGITKYKAKKKEALSKLKSTEDNLLRVNDITVEVKRQIASIERQANKARKYKDEYEKLKGLEIRVAEHQMAAFLEKRSRIEQTLEECRIQEARLNREQEELSQRLAQETSALGQIEQRINDIHAQDIKYDGEIDQYNQQIGFNEERIQGIDRNKVKISEQKKSLIERCRLQQEKIEDLKQSLSMMEGAIQSNTAIREEKQKELSGIERSIEEAERKIKEDEEKTVHLTSSQVQLRNQLTDVMKDIQGTLARKRRLELEMEKVLNEKQEREQKVQNVGYQMNAVSGSMQDLAAQKEEKAQLISEIKNQLKELNTTIDTKEKERLFLQSQKDFIEQMSTQYQEMPDQALEGKLIIKSSPEKHHTGIIGKVKSVRTHQQKKGLLSFLTAQQESDLYEIICETKFVELDPVQIANKIDAISDEITKLNFQREEIEENLREERLEFQILEDEYNKKEKTFSILEAQKNDAREEAKRLCDEISSLEKELAESVAHTEETKKKEEELNYELDTINQDIGWCQNDVKEKRVWISGKVKQREEVTVAIAQVEAEIQAEREKLEDHTKNIAMYQETLDGWLEEIKNIDDELLKTDERKEEFARQSEELREKIVLIRRQKEDMQQQLLEEEGQKKELGERVQLIRARIGEVESHLNEARQQKHKEELNEQELSFNEKSIKDRLQQSYKINYEEMSQQAVEAPAEEQTEQVPFDPEAATAELEKLRKRCDSYGNVNLAAMDEYEELKERFEFLTQQQADLLEAKSQLMSTINKINRTTRQLFMDTFTKVGEEFRIYFRMLFGGGEAQLVLLDPDNVLESGIEIVARPPGKKLQSISLLSGGEKTLTAIALVFGVFKVNPSPFCILDEIDAALDESNVGRFSYLLQDFSKIAQFIVITHNRKTIESSNVIYGITMPETGISKIVSVKIAEEDKEKEAVAVTA